ncbi:MAG: DM13 domain-containing protein [Nannocystaceae bacterium]
MRGLERVVLVAALAATSCPKDTSTQAPAEAPDDPASRTEDVVPDEAPAEGASDDGRDVEADAPASESTLDAEPGPATDLEPSPTTDPVDTVPAGSTGTSDPSAAPSSAPTTPKKTKSPKLAKTPSTHASPEAAPTDDDAGPTTPPIERFVGEFTFVGGESERKAALAAIEAALADLDPITRSLARRKLAQRDPAIPSITIAFADGKTAITRHGQAVRAVLDGPATTVERDGRKAQVTHRLSGSSTLIETARGERGTTRTTFTLSDDGARLKMKLRVEGASRPRSSTRSRTAAGERVSPIRWRRARPERPTPGPSPRDAPNDAPRGPQRGRGRVSSIRGRGPPRGGAMKDTTRGGLVALILSASCSGGGGANTGETATSTSTTGGETSGTTAGAGEGESVYREPIADGNTFACATCHALTEPAADGLRRPGHPIGDATRRPSYKNGQLPAMLDAVNSCLVEWMNAEPWSADDPRWTSLYAWLDAQAPEGAASPIAFSITPPPADLGGGDPSAGEALFNGSCAVCHGPDGVGTERAPRVAGYGYDPAYVGLRVRLSGAVDSPIYPGLQGGKMPFWAADRLSDGELRDLAAWLAIEDEPATTTDATTTDATTTDATTDATTTDATTDATTDGSTSTGGGCPSTHAHIGWVATLETHFHNVGGTAEIVDDCTIVIHDFTYDGTGIDVRIYGGLAGDYDKGFAMTDDLLKPGGYDGVPLVAQVPDGRSLDDLDGISVWCVDVGVDFGSGSFAPP